MAISLIVAACGPQPSSGGGGGVGYVDVPPNSTDPSISGDPLYPNFAIPPSGTPKHRLVVLFNGTGAGPNALAALGSSLAADGYHVIGLRYASSVGTQSACPDSALVTDIECHRAFRGEVVFGGGVADPDGFVADNALINVSAANSVVNRLVKLVAHLDAAYPLVDWSQYLRQIDEDCIEPSSYGGCAIDWTKVVALGHSQGAGVALYLGKKFPLARVGMLSGAYDAFWDAGNSSYVAAPWVAEGSFATPVGSIASFSHLSDYGLPIQRAVGNALGLTGPEVNVTTAARPYGGTDRLVTNVTPACLLDSNGAHSATATDPCSPAYVHVDAWRYLAGGA